MEFNLQFNEIPQSATVAVADKVLRLKAAGKEIIPLQVGDPDFRTPQGIVDAAGQSLQAGLTHYGPSRGFLDLRQAIAARVQKRVSGCGNGKAYDPEREIIVTHGGVHAYYVAMQSILNPGDEALIPDPSWATHTNMVRLLRGKAVPVAASPENGFLPLIEAWESAITPKTKAMVINYPANPTGAVPDYAYMEALLGIARKHNIWVISDEVYDNIYYGEEPVSAAGFAEHRDHVILINSFSKTFAMTGWRIGYIAGPERLIDNALKASQNSITSVAPFIQKGAQFALTDKKVQEEILEMRQTYARRRAIILEIAEEFNESPVKVIPPKGAFYFFLDFRPLKIPSVDLCERILDEAGVGLVPGVAFGAQGEGFARLCFAASDADVRNGIRAIMDWADRQ